MALRTLSGRLRQMRARRCSPPNGPSGRHIKDAAPAPDAVGLRPGDHRRREQTRTKTAQLWLERMKESSLCSADSAKEWILYVKITKLGRAGRTEERRLRKELVSML